MGKIIAGSSMLLGRLARHIIASLHLLDKRFERLCVLLREVRFLFTLLLLFPLIAHGTECKSRLNESWLYQHERSLKDGLDIKFYQLS